jgi:glutaredoxin
MEHAVCLAEPERAQDDGPRSCIRVGHVPASLVSGVEGTFPASLSLQAWDGESPDLQHALVRLLRPREGAARVARDRVRGGLARRRPAFRQKLFDLTGGWTVPQILIDGRPIGGYTELWRLDRDGRLAERLAA